MAVDVPHTVLMGNTALSGAVLPWPLHPACAVWPEMSPPALRDTADDIAANGLNEAITLTPDGQLLDGRNRALACIMAGVDPAAKTVVHQGDPWAYSLSKNKFRRHMSDDQLAMVAARLVTTAQGMNRFVDSSNELSIAKAAEAVGVSETSIKSARAVLKYGAPEDVKAVDLGCMPVRKAADRVREGRRALAPPAAPKPLVRTEPTADPIAEIADRIVTRFADGDWRTADKIANSLKVAPTAARDALKSLGDECVKQRKTGNGIEFRVMRDEESELIVLLAAKDEEIAALKNKVVDLELEIERLEERLTAPTVSAPPAPKAKSKAAKTKSDTGDVTLN